MEPLCLLFRHEGRMLKVHGLRVLPRPVNPTFFRVPNFVDIRHKSKYPKKGMEYRGLGSESPLDMRQYSLPSFPACCKPPLRVAC